MGTSGEYSDRREWPVIAYHDEGAAKRHVEAAQSEAIRLEEKKREAIDNDEYDFSGDWDEADENKNKYDDAMEWYGSESSRYFYMTVPIGDGIAID